MKKITNFFKQLRLTQLLTVVLATVVLFVGTACNSGDVRGARPDNLPVQAGGANNPYKAGGDTNTNYNLSPDPNVSSNTQADRNIASLPIFSNRLIAASDKNEILYPGAEEPINRVDVEKALPKISMDDFKSPEPGGQIQRESDAGERLQDRLSVVKEAFDKASDFISEDAQEALERHEALPRPGLD